MQKKQNRQKHAPELNKVSIHSTKLCLYRRPFLFLQFAVTAIIISLLLKGHRAPGPSRRSRTEVHFGGCRILRRLQTYRAAGGGESANSIRREHDCCDWRNLNFFFLPYCMPIPKVNLSSNIFPSLLSVQPQHFFMRRGPPAFQQHFFKGNFDKLKAQTVIACEQLNPPSSSTEKPPAQTIAALQPRASDAKLDTSIKDAAPPKKAPIGSPKRMRLTMTTAAAAPAAPAPAAAPALGYFSPQTLPIPQAFYSNEPKPNYYMYFNTIYSFPQ